MYCAVVQLRRSNALCCKLAILKSKEQTRLLMKASQAYLQLRWQQLEDVVNLVLEPTRKHLVSLVQDEHPDGVSPQGATTQHIVDAARRAHDDVHSSLKDAGILAHGGTTHTGVTLDLQGRRH